MLKNNKKTVKYLLLLFVAMGFPYLSLDNISEKPTASVDRAEEIRKREEWVDAKFASMSFDERIGQLFMIRAHSDKGMEHERAVERLIKDYHVGGLCFFQGTPEKQVELINRYQKLAPKVPIMVSMDAEWGLGMRFKSDGMSFPRQLMLGAIQDNNLIYKMGKEVARQLRRVGTHINFAPVVDVNNNPNNPVINTRSFGEDRYNVTAKSYMYMKGMQDHQVMACAKHFPGHGDTDVDSHLDLPRILHSRERLDSIEMYPFRVLSQHGIQSVMVAHLSIPSIDNTANLPMTLSSKAINDILVDEMSFEGLIFTDGLGMKGVTKHHAVGELEVKALKAGNDILLLPENTPAAYKKIKEAYDNGTLDSLDIHRKVKKVLRAKYDLGLTSFTPINQFGVRADVTNAQAMMMKRKLVEKALTLVRNKEDALPIRNVETQKIASLAIGAGKETSFQKFLKKYDGVYNLQTGWSIPGPVPLMAKLKEYDKVIVSLHNMSSHPSKNFGVTDAAIRFISQLQNETEVILVVFGNPYSLKYFDGVETILECYEENDIVESVAAQAVFGAIPIEGKLPITASPRSKFNDGETTASLNRLLYDRPEAVGFNPHKLLKIDTIAQEAIDQRATPGLQVMVIKNGTAIFHKAYGHHTYAKKQKVRTDDIYDVASVTKAAAATLSVMKLQDEGKINIEETIGDHLTYAKGSDKSSLKIKDILAHRARLKAWIPFYKETVTESKSNPRPLTKYYKKQATETHQIPVTDRLFMKNTYVQEMWKQIWESELRTNAGYKYSDLGFYMMSEMVKQKSGQSLDDYTMLNFYRPLGLSRSSFNPLHQFSLTEIIPTENDKYFRRQKIHGHVHDMGAAMMGGVSGHAGLFASANDLGIIFQMLLNGGNYGGKQYLQPSTIDMFTSRHPSCTRRGIGFDMKQLDGSKSQNTCPEASANTFGHLGFTGTAVWVDKDNDLIYIFLSNRTFPSMNNYKLNKLDIRPRIQSAIYDAMR